MPTKYNSAVPPRKLYNKLRVSDGAILARNVTYPNIIDDAPISGDDGTVKFLSINEDPLPVPTTEYDARYFFILSTEGPEADWQTLPHPTYFIQYTPTKRPLEEILSNAANEETLIRNSLFPPSEVNGNLSILIVALARQIKGISLLPSEQAALDLESKRAAIFLANKETLSQKQALISSNKEPDLSSGYTASLDA